MKTTVTSLLLLICCLCMAQANKFDTGDFGMRYGVSFNGTATQGLTFSGLVTKHIEVGGTINVQYSTNNTTGNSIQNIYFSGTYAPAVQAITSISKSINASISPFVVYHFTIKNNLDVYSGAKFTVGTGSHNISQSTDYLTQGDGYYNDNYTSNKYPWGYQVGGGLLVGGQYFFYKRLALGVEANLGAAYNSTKGTQQITDKVTNSGIHNSNMNPTYDESVSSPYNSHSFSISTASSIGINLTFYVSRKAKVTEQPKAF